MSSVVRNASRVVSTNGAPALRAARTRRRGRRNRGRRARGRRRRTARPSVRRRDVARQDQRRASERARPVRARSLRDVRPGTSAPARRPLPRSPARSPRRAIACWPHRERGRGFPSQTDLMSAQIPMPRRQSQDASVGAPGRDASTRAPCCRRRGVVLPAAAWLPRPLQDDGRSSARCPRWGWPMDGDGLPPAAIGAERTCSAGRHAGGSAGTCRARGGRFTTVNVGMGRVGTSPTMLGQRGPNQRAVHRPLVGRLVPPLVVRSLVAALGRGRRRRAAPAGAALRRGRLALDDRRRAAAVADAGTPRSGRRLRDQRGDGAHRAMSSSTCLTRAAVGSFLARRAGTFPSLKGCSKSQVEQRVCLILSSIIATMTWLLRRRSRGQ